MTKKKTIIMIIVLSIFLLGFYILKINYSSRGFINEVINKIEGKTLNTKFQTKIKSGNLCTDYNIDQVLSDVDKFDLNTLDVPVVVNITDLTSSNMTVDKGSEERAIELIKKLEGKKINIILDPFPWIENGSVGETEWNPNNKNKFFNNWTYKVLKVVIDDVAIPCHVDALNIGTSFVFMESDEKHMCNLVDYVRKYYKGLVTYRTNYWRTADWEPELAVEYNKKLNNKVFSKLDFISIAAYFELTANDTNTVDNLVAALQSTQVLNRKQKVQEEIKNFYVKWKKPIFFGELGFPKTTGASIKPYDAYSSNIINNQEQANCFEAYSRVFKNETWNLGFSIFSIGDNSAEKRYYPSNESTKILKNWYK